MENENFFDVFLPVGNTAALDLTGEELDDFLLRCELALGIY